MRKDLKKANGEHLGKSIPGKGNSQGKICIFKEHLGGQMFETKPSVQERIRNEIKLNKGMRQVNCQGKIFATILTSKILIFIKRAPTLK